MTNICPSHLKSLKTIESQRIPRVFSAQLPSSSKAETQYLTDKEVNLKKKACDKQLVTNHILDPYLTHNVAASLTSLSPILLPEVAQKVNFIHKGRVLFLKVDKKPYNDISTNLFVRDKADNVIEVRLFNFIKFHENPRLFFEEGTEIALIEPYMKYFNDNEESKLILRCDNPQAVVILKSGLHEKLALKSVKELFDLGYQQHKLGYSQLAKCFYVHALERKELEDNDRIMFLTKLAEVNFYLEIYEEAESAIKEALSFDESNVQVKYILIQILLKRNKITEGLQRTLQLKTQGLLAEDFLKIVYRLVQESRGYYQYHDINLSSGEFHTDFSHASVQFGANIDFYRGSLATADIPANTLISASEALAYLSQQELLTYQFDTKVNIDSDRVERSLLLRNKIINLFHRRPIIGEKLYKLCLEDELVSLKNDMETINIKIIERIVSNNALSSQKQYDKLYEDVDKFVEISSKRRLSSSELSALMEPKGFGLWVNESYLNHSCAPNCTYFSINNRMFVFTTRDIKVGEELTIYYDNVEDSTHDERNRRFSNWSSEGKGFTCLCDHCKLLKNNKTLKAMEEEIFVAHRKATCLVTREGIKLSEATRKVISFERRNEILRAYEDIPLLLQHGLDLLHIMHSSVLIEDSQYTCAHFHLRKAAKIQFKRHGESYQYAKCLWILVGTTLNFGKEVESLKYLEEISKLLCFRHLKKNIFLQLTMFYSTPWLTIQTVKRKKELHSLASTAWSVR